MRTPSFVAGTLIVATLAVLSLAAPWLVSHDPTTIEPLNALGAIGSHGHLLGTDQLGRDVLARLLYAGRIDLRVATLAVLFPFVLGCAVGALAGYVGGWVDWLVMRLVEVVVAFPFYVLVIALVFVLGQGTGSVYVAVTAVSWVAYARIVRAQILVAKRMEYVAAARSGGLGHIRIVGRHILPNVIAQPIVYAMSDIVATMLLIVTLGYLGLGFDPSTPEWGRMIADGQQFVLTQWQLAFVPGMAIVIAGLGFSLIGDGAADLLRGE